MPKKKNRKRMKMHLPGNHACAARMILLARGDEAALARISALVSDDAPSLCAMPERHR